MKKLNLIFRIFLIVVGIAGILHTGIAYTVALNQSATTSFPAEATLFYVGIWYAIGIVALLLVWLVIWLIKRPRGEKETV